MFTTVRDSRMATALWCTICGPRGWKELSPSRSRGDHDEWPDHEQSLEFHARAPPPSRNLTEMEGGTARRRTAEIRNSHGRIPKSHYLWGPSSESWSELEWGEEALRGGGARGILVIGTVEGEVTTMACSTVIIIIIVISSYTMCSWFLIF